MEKNTEISERIIQLIDYLNISKAKFSKVLGYSRPQWLYDVLNNKAKPSYDFFYRLVNTEYSEYISLEWLIAGKGEMLKNDKNYNDDNLTHHLLNDLKNSHIEIGRLKYALEQCQAQLDEGTNKERPTG